MFLLDCSYVSDNMVCTILTDFDGLHGPDQFFIPSRGACPLHKPDKVCYPTVGYSNSFLYFAFFESFFLTVCSPACECVHVCACVCMCAWLSVCLFLNLPSVFFFFPPVNLTWWAVLCTRVLWSTTKQTVVKVHVRAGLWQESILAAICSQQWHYW